MCISIAYTIAMTSFRHIRRDVLGLTQTQLAGALNVTQAAVSQWESGKGSPTLENIRRLRAFAIGQGAPWNDAWIFDAVPPSDVSRSLEEDGAGPANASQAGPAAEV